MDIQKIKRKRMNLRTKIREYIKDGKDASELYVKYDAILEELKQLGVKVSTKNTTNYLIKKEPVIESRGIIDIKKESVIESQLYHLIIAWTNELNFDINLIKNYINDMGLQFFEEEIEDRFGDKEYIIKYKYIGYEESFNLLKKSINFIIDMFPDCNIAVYGKKAA